MNESQVAQETAEIEPVPVESLVDDEIESILKALDECEHKLPVEAIQAARRRRAEIIPRLIDGIRRATDSLRDGAEPNGQLAFLAFFLLLEFRAIEALPAILDAISLPDDGPSDLFGDAIHDHLPRVLIVLGQDRAAEIGAKLFRNAQLNIYVRWSAIKVPIILVATGMRPRDEMMSLCRQLLREAMEKNDSEALTAAIAEMLDLNPWEAADDIKEAFDKRIVDESIINWDDVVGHLCKEPIDLTNEFLTQIYLDDIVAELSGWASFQEKPKPKTRASMPFPIAAPRPAERRLPRPEPGKFTPIEPARKPSVQAERNDPCPCGSGKKFKRCCGGRKE